MTFFLPSGLKTKLAEATTSEAPAPDAVAALEEQRVALEKERDELLQQVRQAPAAEALSELKSELKSKEEALGTAEAAHESLVVELQAAKLALEEQTKSAEDAQSAADLASAKLQVLSTTIVLVMVRARARARARARERAKARVRVRVRVRVRIVIVAAAKLQVLGTTGSPITELFFHIIGLSCGGKIGLFSVM